MSMTATERATRAQRLADKRAAEAVRAARIRRAETRVRALPERSATAVRRRADELQARARAEGDRAAAVTFLERALDERESRRRREPGPTLRAVTRVEIVHPATRECPSCHELRPLADFKPYRAHCRVCHNRKWREWDQARRAAKREAAAGT